jgi:hypothetical protein
MRAILSVAALICAAPSVQAQTFPANESNAKLVHSRAVEAVIWGMAAVNTDLMRQEMLTKTSGKVNQFIYWGRPLDYRNQTLTPNPDTIYFMAFFDTKAAGPIVLEVPPGDARARSTGTSSPSGRRPSRTWGFSASTRGRVASS